MLFKKHCPVCGGDTDARQTIGITGKNVKYRECVNCDAILNRIGNKLYLVSGSDKTKEIVDSVSEEQSDKWFGR